MHGEASDLKKAGTLEEFPNTAPCGLVVYLLVPT